MTNKSVSQTRVKVCSDRALVSLPTETTSVGFVFGNAPSGVEYVF